MAWGSKADNGRAASREPIENVLGQSLTIRGDLNADGGFRIDGKVDGNVESKSAIVVGDSGVVRGDVRGSDIVVAGTIEGNVTCTGHLEILAKGRIAGEIDAKSFRIETGGVFRGISHMGGSGKRVNGEEEESLSGRDFSPVRLS